MHSIAVCLAALPLPYVALPVLASPDPVAFLYSLEPLTVVDLTVDPLIESFSVSTPLPVLALRGVSVRETLEAAAMPLVV